MGEVGKLYLHSISVIFPYNQSLCTQAVEYTTYFELKEPVVWSGGLGWPRTGGNILNQDGKRPVLNCASGYAAESYIQSRVGAVYREIAQFSVYQDR